ncbi:hypothetical protein FXO38_21096 [Capsicum annuum]|nr:hypothetical protein FXO38_21096 [Capsicum annuum]
MPSNLLFLVNGEKIFTVSIQQVEKLHKVFKLCGSPLDDYWKRYKLPLATMFKPKKPYYSTLRDRCKELLKSVVKLIETLLSIDPYKRGAASSALNSEFSYPYWYKKFLVMTKWNVDNIGDFIDKKYGLQIALLDILRGVLNANGEQNGGSATFTKDCKDDYVMELQRPCSVIVW